VWLSLRWRTEQLETRTRAGRQGVLQLGHEAGEELDEHLVLLIADVDARDLGKALKRDVLERRYDEELEWT
jgi:hypothetical protein